MSSLPKEHDAVLPTEAADLRLLRFVSCAHDNYLICRPFLAIYHYTLDFENKAKMKPLNLNYLSGGTYLYLC